MCAREICVILISHNVFDIRRGKVKKIISAIIVFVLALSVLFGCGNTAENPVCEPNLTEVVFADRTVVYDGTDRKSVV